MLKLRTICEVEVQRKIKRYKCQIIKIVTGNTLQLTCWVIVYIRMNDNEDLLDGKLNIFVDSLYMAHLIIIYSVMWNFAMMINPAAKSRLKFA